MSENLRIWSALEKTDPKHTKQFKRGGGFSGTAIKPMFSIRRLTERFGPCGTGWGMTEPTFQLVPGANGETLVYCTVGLWYDDNGTRSAPVIGVGGDKVTTWSDKYQKLASDDEAFKKAYTDALMNAAKQIGVGADVHMGMFEDNKYVRAMEREFAEQENAPPKPEDKPRHPGTSASPLVWEDADGKGILFQTGTDWMLHAEKSLKGSESAKSLWFVNQPTFERIQIGAQSLKNGERRDKAFQHINGLKSFLRAQGLPTELPAGLAA